jgi:Fe-Mn family superoxide dismutase
MVLSGVCGRSYSRRGQTYNIGIPKDPKMPTRRELLAASAAAILVPGLPRVAVAADVPFTLDKLPYDVNALEPVIDAETMTIHHTKHHQAYVDNLNKAVAGTDWAKKTPAELITNLKDVPEIMRTAVQNNAGGHVNHTFFWKCMAKPGTGGEPKGDLLKAIDETFGGVDNMKKAILDAATKRFGSGWAWLVRGKDKPLAVISTPNQDSPWMTGGLPILGVDVWEHAYYLKYRQARAKYVEEWFKVVNWKFVETVYAATRR